MPREMGNFNVEKAEGKEQSGGRRGLRCARLERAQNVTLPKRIG